MKTDVNLELYHRLLHPYNATLVSCTDKDGKPNVLAIAWIIPVSVNPPLLAMSIRPERHSHRLISETKEFVVNIPTFQLAKKVLGCGKLSGREYDKFKELALETQNAKKVTSPIIKDCIAHIECKLIKSFELGDHTLMIGKVVSAYVVKEYFEEVYDLSKVRLCLHVGKDYFTTCERTLSSP
ncbi:MAG: flavin reductase family protein [Promethearchaeota archaeon]